MERSREKIERPADDVAAVVAERRKQAAKEKAEHGFSIETPLDQHTNDALLCSMSLFLLLVTDSPASSFIAAYQNNRRDEEAEKQMGKGWTA